MASVAPTTTAAVPGTLDGDPRARVAEVVGELEAVVRGLDASTLAPEVAVGLLGWFARAAKAATAGQAAVAGRVDATAAASRLGHTSTEDLVASRSGVSWGQAARVVETARALDAHPATAEALRGGTISVDQAHAITRAAAVVPSAEADLLALAPTTGLRGLQRRARDVRLTVAMNAPGAYDRMVAAQSLTYRTDDTGMTAGEFRLPPDTGALVTSVLEAQADRHYRTATRQERHDRPHAFWRAEALTTLVTGRTATQIHTGSPPDPTTAAADTAAPATAAGPPDGPRAAPAAGATAGRPPRAEVIVHVSLDALRRGTVEGDEHCLVQGSGPIPVERARQILDHHDPLVRAVLLDGTDVTRVLTLGRHIPTEIRVALTAEAITRDGTLECSTPGCDTTHGLEWDHVIPVHHGGPTTKRNIKPLCRPDHHTKTARDLHQQPRRARDGPDP